MMQALQTQKVSCAYCGERIEVLIDCSIEHQEYVEDCQVCCRPLVFTVVIYDDDINISIRFEDE
jgi:hypothetical protein